MPTLKKIIIADDNVIYREGLKQAIALTSEFIVVDEVGSDQELLQKVQDNEYDLMILDISVPGFNGLVTLAEVKRIRPSLPVLVMSLHSEEHYALRAYKSGASGYLVMDCPASELIEALQRLALGKKFVSSDLVESIVSRLNETTPIDMLRNLSSREYQVLGMIASGKSAAKIAVDLTVRVKTINNYRSKLLRKFNMQSISELTSFAIENQII